MPTELRNFLALSYDELEELNLKAKEHRRNRVASYKVQEDRLKYLTDEKPIKAVTVLFSDLEGRLHMLDYDKKFLLKSWDNLTFDGSSIRGFTAQRESNLRIGIDWAAFYWAPADVLGSGKVWCFGEVIDKAAHPTLATLRSAQGDAEILHKKKGYTLNTPTKLRDSYSKAPTRNVTFTKRENLNTSIPAAIITPCPATPCARSSTPRRKYSARWVSRIKKTIPKLRLAF